MWLKKSNYITYNIKLTIRVDIFVVVAFICLFIYFYSKRKSIELASVGNVAKF